MEHVPLVQVRRLDRELPLPARARAGDAGLDLYAAEEVELLPGERASVRTGIAIAIPEGYVGLVVPRSGLAARDGIAIVNAPGVIDSGYRGEVRVLLVNLDARRTFRASRGARIAQLLIQPAPAAALVEVEDLPQSDRGEQGFGSSGP